MKGKSSFTQTEADQIQNLIKRKLLSDKNDQKTIRNQIRKLGFYASDFGLGAGYTERDFLNAVTIIRPSNNHLRPAQASITTTKIDKSNTSELIINSFPPIIPPQPKALILGTMPGKRSLAKNQYYGHGGNSFWKIMMQILNEPHLETYEQRTEILKNKGIALWDVLKACVRESSADSDIESEEPNDFNSLFQNYPSIKAIFFNGKKAAQFFQQYVGPVNIEQHILPSTSPANSWATYEEKLEEWNKIRNYL